jgi:uncharacterized membrane protein SpoIIM required for sporulation
VRIAKRMKDRQPQWEELERLCDAMELRGKTDKALGGSYSGAEGIQRFASLYRSACADLALADAYQLPPATVAYLHRLVARAHNQLYRANRVDFRSWIDVLFVEAPKRIFADPCVRVSAIVFFGLFCLSMYLAFHEQQFPGYAEAMAGQSALEQAEDSFEQPLNASLGHYIVMSGFYIQHNTGIGLRCFAWGILIIPCLYVLASNAIQLGAVFGYMARSETASGDHFFQFVTAHGPFELTAIALSAAAGLRLGIGLFYTSGLSRIDSVRVNASRAVPIMGASAMLFVLAAFTEGFLSPSPTPYVFKALWAILSSGLISFYFVILGFNDQPTSDVPFGKAKEDWDAA